MVAWTSWRLLGWLVAAVAALVGWLANELMLWWDMRAVAAARPEKWRLQMEVAEMQGRWDDWAKRGIVVKLKRCGLKSKPCIRVDEGAGAFEVGGHADYRMIQGY